MFAGTAPNGFVNGRTSTPCPTALHQRRCSSSNASGSGRPAQDYGPRQRPSWTLKRRMGLVTMATASQAAEAAAAAKKVPITRGEQQTPMEVADKLIGVFRQRNQEDWRKLIAFSKQWPQLAPVVFDRLGERSKADKDPGEQLELRRLLRRLQQVHEELQDYDKLIAKFRSAPTTDWESIVSSHRPEMPQQFFDHIHSRIMAAHEEAEEQEALSALAVQVASLLAAMDKVAADEEAMDTAAQQFHELLKVSSLQEADQRIDQLAASGQLSPALLLTMAKAYAGAKDTDMTREEVKDVMAHLYFKAKESFAAEQPAEVRILKHLLTMEDPVDVSSAMQAAFTPSDTPSVLSAGPEDQLSTTPPRLEATIDAVLQAFDAQANKAGMVGDAANLMQPEVIERMRRMLALLRKQFM